MSALDPSYIRSIRDGIINGNIEANNQEALPDGLVGLYDRELFPPTMKWKERKEILHFFLVFALAQKEIVGSPKHRPIEIRILQAARRGRNPKELLILKTDTNEENKIYRSTHRKGAKAA